MLSRGRDDDGGGGGGARGVIYLSSGFMVMKALAIEDVDALLIRGAVTSIGTQRVLRVCPGIYGQWVVEGRDRLWVSVPSSSSY